MTTAVITATRPIIGQLLLVRMVVSGKKPPSSSKLRDDVSRLVRDTVAASTWESVQEHLILEGCLARGAGPSVRLTDTGRSEAMKFLGVQTLPPRADWRMIKSRFLLPKAMGLAPLAADQVKRLDKEEKLAALVLKNRFDLPASAGSSLREVVIALACRELGRTMGPDGPTSLPAIMKQLPRFVTGAVGGGLEGLRTAVLRNWTAEADPFDLAAFAATVKAVARTCAGGRFGDNKVFISHLWRQLQNEPSFPRQPLHEFKSHLTEANTAGLLRLSRADLVEAMDPNDVRESETSYLNATFHFVLVDKEQQ